MNTLNRIIELLLNPAWTWYALKRWARATRVDLACRLGHHTWMENGWTGGTTWPSRRGPYRICVTSRCRGILHRI
jgi:hypothetical protein